MSRIVIIGAGECGVRAAFALREQGCRDSVVLIGEEAVLPYERPPLSKGMSAAQKPIRAKESFAEAGIDLRLGHVVTGVETASRTVHLADGTVTGYDKLVLATGARARLFPGMEGCLTLRTARDAADIMAQLEPGARIGIVGGGFIGLELAATARKAGAEVLVFEAGPRILGRAIPQDIAEIVHRKHVAEGVTISTGVGVTRADARNVSLANGSSHSFDVVVAGVGAVPNTELAAQAGLVVENGIVVDEDFRTSEPDIFAAGDCCNFEWRGSRVRLESWKAAQDQGAHVAAVLSGNSELYSKVPWFWSDQYDSTLQVAGLFDQSQPVCRRETEDETHIVFQCSGADRLIAAAGIGPCNAVARDIRIFEKLIERGAAIDTRVLADPSQNLKRLLKAA